MAESIVSDWINDFNALEPEELKSFAALHTENHELSTAIHTVLNDRSKHTEFLHPICNQLFNFYRSNENALKCFTLQFIPTLIYLYLNGIACGEKQNFRCVETLLLCAYNIEACSDNGALKSVSFRMPVLAQTSIYHEEKNLHASDLKRYEENINKVINWKITQQVTKLIAQNRLDVMASLMYIFNQQISLIPKSAFYQLCKSSSKLVAQGQGFTKYGHSYRASYGNEPMNTSISSASSVSSSAPNKVTGPPRIQLSQQLLLELLHAVYFAMFNEFASVAIQAVDDIHTRACYELFSDVILVTNAIKNSLQANPSGQPSDGPMGISVALTPSTTTVTVSKSMITNASFRTKKLPDDIPIQNDSSTTANSSINTQQLLLGSINEEQESDTNSAKIGAHKASKEHATKHKAFGGLKKLIDRDKDSKDKDKDKDKEKSEKGTDKMEKELSKAASAIKSGLSDTKENMKKLMGKDKQKSSQSMTITSSSSAAAAAVPVTNHHDENNQTIHANNGDLKNSPLVLIKRASDVTVHTSDSIEMSTQFSFESNPAKTANEASSGGVNGASHGIISPFDSLNSDSDSEVDHPHHQLSTSSSASVNIIMDGNSKTNNNIQVSQI